MSLISIQVPNLIQGVSQQPPQMRLPSQLEEQVNAYPSITDGLTKRPPIHHVAKLADDAATQFVHFINRDNSERYVVRSTASTLKVFTLAGAELPVYTALTGTTAFTVPSYLNTPGNLKAVTVADYTFLLNTAETVAMAASTSAAQVNEALVTVIQAGYSIDYTVVIRVSGADYSYTVAAPGTSGTLKSTSIAATIRNDINAATGTHGVTATLYGNTIYLTRSGAFTVKAFDSGSNNYISCAKDKVSRISDLPLEAKHGFKIEVVSDIEDPEATGYYVTFVANDGIGGTGIWEETIGFSTKTSLSDTTMPYVLVRRSDGNFACYKPTWGQRTVGDSTSAPDPSFVSRKIKDIFLFRNRLGVIAGDKVVLSEAGQYFNFFRTSTTMVLPQDPIDVSVSHNKVATLEAAVPWDDRLILFSDLTQFSLGSGGDSALTPQTVEVVATTEFESSSDQCRPEATGRSILFTQHKGTFTGVREYVRISVEEKYDGMDITAAVPAYITGTPKQIAVSTHDSTAFLRTTDGIWNYKWFVNGTEKIQSAWSKWDIGSGAAMQGMEWFDASLYIVVTRASKTYLERVDFDGRFLDAGLTWGIHLDRRVTATATTTGAAAGTTIVPLSGLGIDYSSLSPVVVIGGVQRQVVSVSATQAVVTGSFNGQTAYVGIPYEMRWTFSRPYLRNGDIPVTDGRMQLTYGTVSFDNTGHFKVAVTPKYRDPFTYVFDGGILGANIVIGAPFISSDSFRFPIHCKANDATITVTSTSHLPCRIQSASFEAHFTTRSRPV